MHGCQAVGLVKRLPHGVGDCAAEGGCPGAGDWPPRIADVLASFGTTTLPVEHRSVAFTHFGEWTSCLAGSPVWLCSYRQSTGLWMVGIAPAMVSLRILLPRAAKTDCPLMVVPQSTSVGKAVPAAECHPERQSRIR